jgi:RNA-directed DNA polymerase
MRPLHPSLLSVGFQFANDDELTKVFSEKLSPDELGKVLLLFANGLPPVTSRAVLAALLGVNPGLIWSLTKRTKSYYRFFSIPKGDSVRRIQAPKAVLKVIQKWLSIHLTNAIMVDDHVFGFVPTKTHIDAAVKHLKAEWIFETDIENFFRTTPIALVKEKLLELGYPEHGAELISELACLEGYLAQGSPLSPVLSNLCFATTDISLKKLAEKYGCRVTRYADDIVFSGVGSVPSELQNEVESVMAQTPWKLSGEKTKTHKLPNRLKVHGLLVHGIEARLTKGYRNKLRAFQHLIAKGAVDAADLNRLKGHVSYSKQVIERIELIKGHKS